jgi:hypothetical protein
MAEDKAGVLDRILGIQGTVEEVHTALHEEIEHAHEVAKDLIDHAELAVNRLLLKVFGPGIDGLGGVLRALQDTGAELEVAGLSQPIKLVIGTKKK